MQNDFISYNMEKIRDMMDIIPKSFFTNEHRRRSWGVEAKTEYLFIEFSTSYTDDSDTDYIRIFFKGDGIIKIHRYTSATNLVNKYVTLDTHSYRFKNGSMIERFGEIMKKEFNISWWCT